MNSDTRTECVEVLFNHAELNSLTKLCKALGIAKSTFLRGLANQQIRTDGMSPPPKVESRGCRGAGRPASRASFGGGSRPLRV